MGDALGLPFEGLSPRRVARRMGSSLKHQFLLGRGMVSDDTDHAIFAAQTLIRCKSDVDRFRCGLSWRLRWWLACLPAGIGLATLKSILRLWFGIQPSGVRSAGNGPCMRSAILGAYFCEDPATRSRFVDASSSLTHTDERALAAARAVAELAAALASGRWFDRPRRLELEALLKDVSCDAEWQNTVEKMIGLSDSPLEEAAEHFGGKRGVSGYALHSVPFAILAWHRHFGDYPGTVEAAIRCGGDADTIAAIAGALAGISVGSGGIPQQWRDRLIDWPHSVRYIQILSKRLASENGAARTNFSPWLFPRGILFTLIVLLHGFGRLVW